VLLSLVTTGTLTLMLGILHGPVITPTLVILQTTSSVCFFPAALAMASSLFPSYRRGFGVSLMVLIGMFFGWGVIPPAIGYLADASSFSLGFCFTGILVLTIMPLLFSLGVDSRVDE